MVDTAVFERIPPPAFGKENEMDVSGQHSPNVGAGFFLVRDEALRLLILDYGEQEGFIAPQSRKERRER